MYNSDMEVSLIYSRVILVKHCSEVYNPDHIFPINTAI